MERPRNYADPAKTTYIPAGPLTFGIEYRHLQTDQGICIHVFGDLNGKEEEFLRFDCFERAPHYHYAWSTDDEYVALDTTAEGDPLQWTLERLRTRLPAMLIRAGAGELTRTLDQRDIDAALPTIQGWAESLQTRERREREGGKKEIPMIKTHGLNHIALKVKDPERTAQFYTALFNMEITRSTPDMTFLKTIGSTDMMTLNRSEAEVAAGQGMVHFGFIVEPTQFDAALETIEAQGARIVSGPGSRDQGRYVFIEDPDGYTVEIFECLLPPYESAQ